MEQKGEVTKKKITRIYMQGRNIKCTDEMNENNS